MSKRRRQPISTLPPVALSITALSHEGRGIAHHLGKTVFVSGALAGEEVVAAYTKRSRRHDDAKVVSVTTAAALRVPAPCKHFGLCGGCSLQHLAVDAQIQLKQQMIIEQFQRFSGLMPEEIVPAITAEPLGYRRRARLGVKYVDKKYSVLVGFREQHSGYLAELTECLVLDKSVGFCIKALRTMIASLSCFRDIPQIEVAIGDEGTALIFRHLKPLTDDDLSILKQFAKQHQFHLYLQPNKLDSIHKIFPDEEMLMSYQLPDYQLRLFFHPAEFIQVNANINQQMVVQALAWLDIQKNDNALDLFCGLGNFSLPMARLGANVTGVEGASELVQRARSNALHNEIDNADFYTTDLTQPVNDAWSQQTYNKILIDPPRVGAEAMMPEIKKWQPERIVYVSCHPATFARDAGILVNELGYHFKRFGVMDMFTHTAHVESMGLFVQK